MRGIWRWFNHHAVVTLMLPVKMATPLSVIVGTRPPCTPLGCHVKKRIGDRQCTDYFLVSGNTRRFICAVVFTDHFMKVGLGGFLILYSFYSCLFHACRFMTVAGSPHLSAPGRSVRGSIFNQRTADGYLRLLRNLGPAAFRGTLNAFFTATTSR